MNSISTFDITKEALPDFLLHIQQGKIQLPDLQRSFCWPDDQVKELIASVSLAWPVGAVLLLLLGNSNVKFKPRLIEGVTLKIIPEPFQTHPRWTATLHRPIYGTLFRSARLDKRKEKPKNSRALVLH
jgi:hypothetical protein